MQMQFSHFIWILSGFFDAYATYAHLIDFFLGIEGIVCLQRIFEGVILEADDFPSEMLYHLAEIFEDEDVFDKTSERLDVWFVLEGEDVFFLQVSEEFIVESSFDGFLSALE